MNDAEVERALVWLFHTCWDVADPSQWPTLPEFQSTSHALGEWSGLHQWLDATVHHATGSVGPYSALYILETLVAQISALKVLTPSLNRAPEGVLERYAAFCVETLPSRSVVVSEHLLIEGVVVEEQFAVTDRVRIRPFLWWWDSTPINLWSGANPTDLIMGPYSVLVREVQTEVRTDKPPKPIQQTSELESALGLLQVASTRAIRPRLEWVRAEHPVFGMSSSTRFRWNSLDRLTTQVMWDPPPC